jgi:hypothetical protein
MAEWKSFTIAFDDLIARKKIIPILWRNRVPSWEYYDQIVMYNFASLQFGFQNMYLFPLDLDEIVFTRNGWTIRQLVELGVINPACNIIPRINIPSRDLKMLDNDTDQSTMWESFIPHQKHHGWGKVIFQPERTSGISVHYGTISRPFSNCCAKLCSQNDGENVIILHSVQTVSL